MAHIKKVIRASALLGIKRMNTFVGRDWTKSVDDNWPRFLKTWRPIIELAEDLDVKVGIENCAMFFTNDEWPGGKNLAISPAIWRRMFADIPSPNFGLNYDPSHMIWQHMDYLAPMREFRDRLFHVHAKDVMIDADGLYENGVMSVGMGWQVPRMPGLGGVDWPGFFAGLYRAGYDGPVVIEHEDRDFEGTDDKIRRGFLLARDVLAPFVT